MNPIKVISAEPFSLKDYWKEVYSYRELVWLFARQELSAMFAQTYFGILWTVVKPVLTLAVFTVIFRFFLQVPSQSPYYLFAFSGLIAWNLFSQLSINGSSAVMQKQLLIRKMYFPKLTLVIAKVLVASIETFISITILFFFILIEGIHMGTNILWLPLFLFLNVACGLAVAVWMNALNIQFRDINQLLPTVIGIGVWVTPIFYPVTIIPERYKILLYANPMAGVIKGYRYAFLNEQFPEPAYWLSITISMAFLLAGVWYFSRVEDEMVDYS